jgi:hypothetical protein
MAEWQNGRMVGMADGMVKMVRMVEWQEYRMEWLNGRNGYIRTIYVDGMVKMVGMVDYLCGRKVKMVGMVEWREWHGGNGGMV